MTDFMRFSTGSSYPAGILGSQPARPFIHYPQRDCRGSPDIQLVWLHSAVDLLLAQVMNLACGSHTSARRLVRSLSTKLARTLWAWRI